MRSVQRFVTLVMVVIDPHDSKAQVVLAGHMAPIHRKADGTVEEKGDDVAGLPLGITDSLGYEQYEISIAPGETLTLYTDGINECANAQNEMYSIDRLRGLIKNGDVDPEDRPHDRGGCEAFSRQGVAKRRHVHGLPRSR